MKMANLLLVLQGEVNQEKRCDHRVLPGPSYNYELLNQENIEEEERASSHSLKTSQQVCQSPLQPRPYPQNLEGPSWNSFEEYF